MPRSTPATLLNEAGEVIGVNSQSRGDGLSFAVPVDTVKKVVADLRRDGRVRRPYLGVSTTDRGSGALVTDVPAAGPADEAGVRAGDVIVELGGRRVRSPNDLARAIGRRRPGDTVEVVVERDGRRVTMRAELIDRPRNR
jgi:S1-C subfamily serine protease